MTGPAPLPSRERSRAAAIVVALLLGSLGLWGVALLTTGSADRERDVFAGVEPATPRSEPAAPGSEPAAPGSQAPTPDTGSTSSPEDDGDGPRTSVDLGGGCVVEVADGTPVDELRPWQFEECDRAPVVLSASEERWVAVIESLSDADFSEEEALARFEGEEDRLLLWSSHYPSLNPGLWVIVAGPFDDQEAATEAARRIGGGAYPRALTDDDGDRYCVAADGCVGETRP
jgi:hypothetical protein